jgi:replication-associated recombination protein RarA
VTAAEDVGNAAPMASMLAFQAMQAVKELGLPEARIHLSQTVQFIATAPKSNAAIERVEQALSYVRQHPSQPIPSHLRDSHYQGAKDLHGGGYQNPHRHAGHQTYLPEGAQGNFPSWSSRGHRVREEEKDLEALKTSLLAMLRRGSWQDFDPKEAAVRLEAPEEKIKQALNGLIQEGVLKFRRLIAYDLE